jgi:ferritin-like metal-binding protein YciE
MKRSLEELLTHELKDLYDAEHQLTQALPKMIAAVTFGELKLTLEEHLKETEAQVTRLEAVFEALDMKPSRITCKGIKGIINEGEESIEETVEGAIRDAAIIASAQRAEHYEMASYGTARTYAYLLGHAEVAKMLQQTLDEEEHADKKLTQVANSINALALE